MQNPEYLLQDLIFSCKPLQNNKKSNKKEDKTQKRLHKNGPKMPTHMLCSIRIVPCNEACVSFSTKWLREQTLPYTLRCHPIQRCKSLNSS